ncbi:MAG: GTPase Era [Lachnospiraceae bacterium]|jgi:GTP-binding protein Era
MEFEKKSGFVSIIGRPNVGKSTLLNTIVGQKIAITSNKPQTTRNRIRAVYNGEEGQVVFVDTPGMISRAGNRLGEYMIKSAKSAVADCDAILWLIEPSSYIGKEDKKISEILKKSDIPVILVINKIDSIEKTKLLAIIDSFRQLMDFEEIIPISALRNKNVDELMENIFKYIPYGPEFYDPDTVTDQTERQIVAEMIREKSLHALGQEIPHGIAVVIDTMTEREDSEERFVDIEATIVCEKESHKRIIIGKNGAMLKKIGTNARFEIERMLDCRIYLKLYVKVRNNWRDSQIQMKNFGYNSKEIL